MIYMYIHTYHICRYMHTHIKYTHICTYTCTNISICVLYTYNIIYSHMDIHINDIYYTVCIIDTIVAAHN